MFSPLRSVMHYDGRAYCWVQTGEYVVAEHVDYYPTLEEQYIASIS